jgi:UDP-N-acetylglucosamine 4,6-dehydratase/5-epimerase
MLKGKTILVTGGTGSFGQRFIRMTLEKYNPKKIIVYSRDEMKQWAMSKGFQGEDRIRYFIGDVRDQRRLSRAFDSVDIVIHAAATKIVPIAELDPFECIKTNVYGAMNVIDTAIDRRVEKVVALSTDKASSPINLYGATKLVSDKLFVSGNSYAAGGKTRFSVVRYGNVMGSRGSIIPYFLSLGDGQSLPVTDTRMTRFMITLEQGVDLVWAALDDMQGGEIYVKKIPSMNVIDIVKAISVSGEYHLIGIRPGEKLHEQMIGPDDAAHTYEYKDFFKILPSNATWGEEPFNVKESQKVKDGFSYSSDSNADFMGSIDLKQWIEVNRKIIGKI